MIIYTLFEIITSGEIDNKEILNHHILPTFFIGVIIWAVLTLLLRSKFVTPIRVILDHLNHIGNGRLAPLENPTQINEIGAIITGVNDLTSKLKNAPSNKGFSNAFDDLVQLRRKLKEVIDRDEITPDHLVPVMKGLKQLEGNMLSALQTEGAVPTQII